MVMDEPVMALKMHRNVCVQNNRRSSWIRSWWNSKIIGFMREIRFGEGGCEVEVPKWLGYYSAQNLRKFLKRIMVRS